MCHLLLLELLLLLTLIPPSSLHTLMLPLLRHITQTHMGDLRHQQLPPHLTLRFRHSLSLLQAVLVAMDLIAAWTFQLRHPSVMLNLKK